MHIVLLHGYFLKGTGSNLFVLNVCRELCKIGHQVTLFCQENKVQELDFIEKAFAFNTDNTKYAMVHSKETHYPGKCSLYRPNLNGFLPVYVYDQYEGYSVKELTACTGEEIERYINYNKDAINCALEGTIPDMVWTNHTILQPVYVARSNLGKGQCLHVMTVHGSCLNFSVRKSLALQDYAWEAIRNAKRIVFVSQFSNDEFLEFFNYHPMIMEKSVVIPAGVDLDKFQPLNDTKSKGNCIQTLLENLETEKLKRQDDFKADESSWQTDENIVNKLSGIDFESERIVLYYGKYLWTKGIQFLIAAAPLIIQRHPNTRFILVGYGSSRAYFEAMVDALNNRKQEDYIQLLKYPEKFDAEIDKSSSQFFLSLVNLLQDPDFADNYFSVAENEIKSKIVFTGFLQHDHLKDLVACSELVVVPSIFPEAFGLVAVEALSAGIIPIQTNHTGFTEVIKKYVTEFRDLFDKTLNPLYLNEHLVLNMANNISILLGYLDKIDEQERQLIRQRARKVSVNNYSWEAIVNKYF